MMDAHLPADLFGEGMCEDYEDEAQDVLARAFGIVVDMRGNGVEPNSDTYRRDII